MEIKYSLKSLVEDKYYFNYDYNYAEMKEEDLRFSIGQSISPNMEKEEIEIGAVASLVDSAETKLVENSVRLTFTLAPIQGVISQESGKISTKEPIVLDTFLITAFGALRGIMFKNLKGTPLDGIVLPLIPTEYFKEKKTTTRQK